MKNRKTKSALGNIESKSTIETKDNNEDTKNGS
jgi:hypothetical protein